MTRVRSRGYTAILLVSGACAWGASAPPARAINAVKPVCTVASWFSGLVGKACSAVQNGGRFIDAGKKLLTGHLGGAVKTAFGAGGSAAGRVASTATTALALAAIGTWVLGGARFVLHETSTVLGKTTAPRLDSPWFSATYWRVAGIAAVLTLPFLFAAAVQALIRSDLSLLLRAAFGYLPLAMLAVAIAAPLTMLLLAASDQLASVVSSAAADQSGHFLDRSSGLIGGLTGAAGSPFVGVFVCLLTVAGGFALWIELLMRAAAVYVIVLMLPLAFAAFVWPARRVWAVRAVELLVALILSKFAVVAVLSLGGAALSQSAGHSVAGMLAGGAMLALGAFAPWALLRLMPLAEIASGAAGSLRNEIRAGSGPLNHATAWALESDGWATRTAEMRNDADRADLDDAATAEQQRLDDARPGSQPAAAAEEAVSGPVAPGGAVPGTQPSGAGAAPQPAGAGPPATSAPSRSGAEPGSSPPAVESVSEVTNPPPGGSTRPEDHEVLDLEVLGGLDVERDDDDPGLIPPPRPPEDDRP